ncbi:Protein of unknown function DUF262 [Sphingomonas palmae]|uniref:GmrSD restriction endonucleases N-terminal domain-containing protein n=1 Tax=Sphingomonas palmae TaxID=1855283 RepID=A0A1H7UEV7_9SPHN|nr:DUF262 domain-containing protein [Sphingomonas palmae]SEL95602.1 Protein of unknown function DUF262 [Sphingomonas palmae]
MDTPLNASANNAGAVFSNNMFEIPRFQREYSWGEDEVDEFWTDLKNSLEMESYFVGLMIFTNPPSDIKGRKHVVDGQQRIITISLLANALYHEAIAKDRKALAERIQASFLRAIDYESDEQVSRVRLSDPADNLTFQSLLSTGSAPQASRDDRSVSAKMIASYNLLVKRVRDDLRPDPFKRLGRWTEFLTNRLYLAIFVHPNPDLAYQVYEVINTRGKDLTTADLLKNYILSQSGFEEGRRYDQWQEIAKQFSTDGANNFVQYIRHVVTVESGYVLPKDLFGFIAGRTTRAERAPPAPHRLMELLQSNLPLYLQMIDSTSGGPADSDALGVFSALSGLGVLTVRPILLACAQTNDPDAGMEHILRLVVRRMVVGNLGTGNVERKFGEAARLIRERRDWRAMVDGLNDLNPSREDFVNQLKKRSLNKALLSLLRRSIIQNTITPATDSFLHFIWTKNPPFGGLAENEGSYWASTIGNTFLSKLEKRPRTITDWESFKVDMLPTGADGEWTARLDQINRWDAHAIENLGIDLAAEAGRIWYDG